MKVTYSDIVERLLKEGVFSKQMMTLKDVAFRGELEFNRDPVIEKHIPIDIEKKIRFIKRHYYSGPITKKKPCILSVENNVITFRSARLFPTLYIDLAVIAEKFKGQEVTLVFQKLFIGYHILGLGRFHEVSINSHRCYTHWTNRFANDDLKLSMLTKYKEFLDKHEN